MEFERLKGADLAIFNLLRKRGNGQLSHSQIAMMTGYTSKTVYRSLRKLEERGLIERHRDYLGQTCQIRICS